MQLARTRLKQTSTIHIMDREADSYEVLAGLIGSGERFVIRANHDRRLVPTADRPAPNLAAALPTATVLCHRDVAVAPRGDRGRTLRRVRHPARAGRVATPRSPRSGCYCADPRS